MAIDNRLLIKIINYENFSSLPEIVLTVTFLWLLRLVLTGASNECFLKRICSEKQILPRISVA